MDTGGAGAGELIERSSTALGFVTAAMQPWEFVVVTEEQSRRRIMTLPTLAAVAEAPVCVAVFCRDCKYYIEDGSAAT